MKRGTVLAFDFGLKRIGVAVGEWETRTAHALETIAGEANGPRFDRIAALIGEWRPQELAVGLPLHLDGGEHDMTRRCRRFAHQLHGRFGLPVALVDERLTSAAAAAELAQEGLAAGRRRASLDSVAARHILQDYLNGTQNHESAHPR